MPDGRVLEGHLFTTVLYVQNDDGAQKVVLEAKQTGADGQKLADLPYPARIHFTDTAGRHVPARSEPRSLSAMRKPPVVVARPDLAPVALEPAATPHVWTLPTPDPKKLVFSVEADDGLHVGWPAHEADPAIGRRRAGRPAHAAGFLRHARRCSAPSRTATTSIRSS